MARCEKLCLTVALVLGFLGLHVHARSWDLAVAIGREVNFYAENGTLTGQAKIKEAENLRAIAYDDVSRTMFLSDSSGNSSIFSYDLADKNLTTKPLLEKRQNSEVISMVFDTASRTLFWIDGKRERIMRMKVAADGPPKEPTLLHDLKGQIPRDMALDVCNSHVYWVNSNDKNPSIERSNLDGSDRVTVIKGNMREPLAVAIDHAEGKLYWIDDNEGIHFVIQRSNLDGSERELVLHSRRQTPVYMAVDRQWIYWSDWTYHAVWRMSKTLAAGAAPTTLKSYIKSNPEHDPAGIVTRDNLGKIDCAAIARMQKRTKPISQTVVRQPVENYNNLTTSTEESDLATERPIYCLNNGQIDNKDGTCQCKPGFSGARCETSLCHNYCLRGTCQISSRGLPKCECPDTFVGARCEKDACDGYCLHDGQCSLEDGKPICECKYSKGSRCEEVDDIATICAMLCANGVQNPASSDVNPCRCAETNQPAERISTVAESFEYSTLLPILSAVIALLVILIVVLSYYVNKLRRRPRIKKRFVVSKGGVTPLTSRPQIPDNQCEITIENCCNMNICETPCFEPKLRTAAPRAHNTKKEEKNSLLDNMDGNSC